MAPLNGIIHALGAYVLWGLLPLYWKQLSSVPSLEILAHRTVWSLLFLEVVLLLSRSPSPRLTARTARYASVASLLLAGNWLLFVWAVNTGRVLEASLGYFINPLMSIALGNIVLGERLRVGQWIAVSCAGIGVAVSAIHYGELPWISLTLAVTFATYGLVKKLGRIGAFDGLCMETRIIAPTAFLYLVYLGWSGSNEVPFEISRLPLLIAASGVATALPLLFFAKAVREVTLTTLGFVQYVSPSLQFGLGVFIFGEVVRPGQVTAFLAVWIGIALYTWESFTRHRPFSGGSAPNTRL